MIVSTVLCVCISPTAQEQRAAPGGMEQWRGSGWRRWGGDVVVWQDGGDGKVGVLCPKALGQGRGHSRRMAQVAWG